MDIDKEKARDLLALFSRLYSRNVGEKEKKCSYVYVNEGWNTLHTVFAPCFWELYTYTYGYLFTYLSIPLYTYAYKTAKRILS
jgi:hypothetical protein